MLIKPMRKKLYASLVVRMLGALLISVLCFIGITSIGERVFLHGDFESKTVLEKDGLIHKNLNTLADDIQELILDKDLSFGQADAKARERREVDVHIASAGALDYFYERIYEGQAHVQVESGKSQGGLSYELYPKSILYEITDGETKGYMLFSMGRGGRFAFFGNFFAMLMSIIVFFLLSLKFIKPTLAYIKLIEGGIQSMAGGNLNVKVPIKGDHELSNLAKSINTMADEILKKTEHEKMIDQNQRTLITNISHDLRTPLTSMIGYVDLIEKKTGDPEVKTYSEVAKKNALRLEKLIDDLFLYTKITSQDVQYKLVKVDINRMIKQMLELRKRSIDFETDHTSLHCLLDIDKFHRVMDNLIANAERHGLDQGYITIKTSLHQGEVVIVISNQTHEDLRDKEDFLLDRLYVANAERKEGSSGLGLSIAQELTEAMDGKISLEAHGHTFSVSLEFNHLN